MACRFWVLSPDHHLYEDHASRVSDLFRNLSMKPVYDPLDCGYCVLSHKRIYMVYFPAPSNGPIHLQLNFAATRILVDKYLLDTITPMKPDPKRPPTEAEEQADMQAAMRCCAYGEAVFFRVDDKEQLLDYPLEELRQDWTAFFDPTHPAHCPLVSHVPYRHLWYTSICQRLLTMTGVPKFTNTVCDHVRVETLMVGRNLYALNPKRWLSLSSFDATVRPFLKKKGAGVLCC